MNTTDIHLKILGVDGLDLITTIQPSVIEHNLPHLKAFYYRSNYW